MWITSYLRRGVIITNEELVTHFDKEINNYFQEKNDNKWKTLTFDDKVKCLRNLDSNMNDVFEYIKSVFENVLIKFSKDEIKQYIGIWTTSTIKQKDFVKQVNFGKNTRVLKEPSSPKQKKNNVLILGIQVVKVNYYNEEEIELLKTLEAHYSLDNIINCLAEYYNLKNKEIKMYINDEQILSSNS